MLFLRGKALTRAKKKSRPYAGRHKFVDLNDQGFEKGLPIVPAKYLHYTLFPG
jgi:hypothetical protein